MTVIPAPTPSPDSPEIPLILLDIDGVLNAVNHRDPVGPGTWPEYREQDADGWSIRWAPAVVSALVEIHESGTAEIQWLTTWNRNDKANRYISPLLGFPQLTSAGEPRFTSAGGWWKFSDAKGAVGCNTPTGDRGRPLVWLDDDLRMDADAKMWMFERKAPSLAIWPRTCYGLSPEDIDRIHHFIQEHHA